MAAIRNNNSSNGSSVYSAIRERISRLDFQAFQTLVWLWLGAKGFKHMRSLGRQSARGRRRVGGADFIAELPGSGHVRMAIGLRHWRTPVQRRAIDELWGFMIRNGISAGMIVTNSKFSNQALQAAMEYPGRPISLVSAAQLAGSLTALGLVVDPATGGKLDRKFFRSLDGLRLGVRTRDREILNRVDSGGSSSQSPEDPRPFLWAGLVLAVTLFLSWLRAAVRGRR